MENGFLFVKNVCILKIFHLFKFLPFKYSGEEMK